MIAATDILGRVHRFESPPRRVVSLVPSLTESLFEFGAGDAVVGATEFCIFPEPHIDRIPKLGGTKNPRVEEIRRLEPDLVYVNLEENLRRHADAIATFAPVFATEPKSVEDVLGLLDQLGGVHQRTERAAWWNAAIRDELKRASSIPRFRFACAIWKEPWMWCGGDTYVSGLVSAVGGMNVLEGEERYPRIDPDGVLARDPDVVFLPDEPWVFTPEDAGALAATTRARIVGPFPGHLFTWHGTRTRLGLRFLRDALG